MTILDPKLLDPISEAEPCGPDYSYNPKLDELEVLLKGQPEVEIGAMHRPAEPPEWGELTAKSKDFLAESKHLRVAVILCCCLLKTNGLPGLREGLELIKAWLEKYWPTVYPLLDVEDNNDPTRRLNILSGLTASRGSVTGWLTIVDYLYAVDAFRSKGSPPITFDQLIIAKGSATGGGEMAKMSSAIPNADKISIGHQQVLQECLQLVRDIDQTLTNMLGSGGTISFDVLEKTLQELESTLKPFLPGAALEASSGMTTENQPQPDAGAGGSPGAINIQGAIRSREDVVRALEAICNYYKQIEPGSPVPYLLRRAQKLARMDFIQAVQELNIATLEALRPSMGSAIETGVPPAAAPTESA